jgi:hypothetical protein
VGDMKLKRERGVEEKDLGFLMIDRGAKNFHEVIKKFIKGLASLAKGMAINMVSSTN